MTIVHFAMYRLNRSNTCSFPATGTRAVWFGSRVALRSDLISSEFAPCLKDLLLSPIPKDDLSLCLNI